MQKSKNLENRQGFMTNSDLIMHSEKGEIMSDFQPIDMEKWPMAQAFYYYTQMAPTSYTVNVNIDVTILRKILKARGYKFFPV